MLRTLPFCAFGTKYVSCDGVQYEDRVVYAMEDMSALFIREGKVELVGTIYRAENRKLRRLTQDMMT